MNSLHLTWFSIKLPISRKTIFLIIYFNWRIITILWWFLPYISMNRPQVYMCTPILNHIYASSNGKERACNVGDLGLIPRLERSPGEGHDNPLQYSCLENPMDRGAWRPTVHGVTKCWTWLKRLRIHAKEKKERNEYFILSHFLEQRRLRKQWAAWTFLVFLR